MKKKSKPNNNDAAALNHLTNEYRIKVAAIFRDDINPEASFRIGRPILQASTITEKKKKEKEEKEENIPISNPASILCQCGNILNPGRCTVRVKSIRRSRTLRRRASREKKVRMLKQTRFAAAKRRGDSMGNNDDEDESSSFGKHAVDCSNVVEYRCLQCGACSRFAGVSVKRTVTGFMSNQKRGLKRNNRVHSNSPMSIRSSKDSRFQFSDEFKSRNKMKIDVVGTSKSICDNPNGMDGSLDFISLDNSSRGKVTATTLTTKRKRKKVPAEKKKKSKLMNFLSSLNG